MSIAAAFVVSIGLIIASLTIWSTTGIFATVMLGVGVLGLIGTLIVIGVSIARAL